MRNVKVQYNRAVFYEYSNHQRKVTKANLSFRHMKKEGFSDKVRARIMEVSESWAVTVEYANKCGKNISLKFVTLTLPTIQFFCDKTVVSSCLLPFLKSLGYFLYVCEKQKNGNIHFHCILDTNISVSNLRKMWNAALESLGIISQYQKERQEFFKNGFVFQDNGFDIVTQQLWYSYGVSTSWKNPRTVDLRVIQNIDNVAGYITKYITKESGTFLCCNRWGAQRLISKLCSPKAERHKYSNEDIENLYSCASKVFDVNEFVSVLTVKKCYNTIDFNGLLGKHIVWHFSTQSSCLYP